jgi:hypothetical protein
MITRMLAGGAGLAALAAAAPAAAQYYPYGYTNPYVYGAQYGSRYYGYNNTALATQRCTAAVQARLNNRTSIGEILGSFLGANTAGRVVSITKVDPNRNTIRVRGLATSGRMAYNNYGPYGVGAYGALGYAYQPDLRFRCDVDYRGYVRDVDIDRR